MQSRGDDRLKGEAEVAMPTVFGCLLWCRGEEKDTERHDEVFGIRIGKLGQWHKAKSNMKQWSKNGRCRTKG